MPLYSFGVSKCEEGIYNPTTGAVTGWKEIEVYDGTISLDWPDAVETPHRKQGDPNPKVTVRKIQPKAILFSVMDTSGKSKKNWMGGDIVTVDGADEWSEAEPAVTSIIKALRFTGDDGSIMTIVRADTYSKIIYAPTDAALTLIGVRGSVTSTGIEGVKGFTWADPKPALP